jgi:hypothetical protein
MVRAAEVGRRSTASIVEPGLRVAATWQRIRSFVCPVWSSATVVVRDAHLTKVVQLQSIGCPGWDRTSDQVINSHLLYR